MPNMNINDNYHSQLQGNLNIRVVSAWDNIRDNSAL